MTTIIDQSLDYSDSKSVVSKGTYRYQQLVPVSAGGSAPTVSLTAQTAIQWEIPSRVVNLSKSYLTFDIQQPAEAAFVHYYATGKSIIGGISLQSRDGQYLCNMTSNANNFYYVTALPTMSINEFLTSDISTTATTNAAIIDTNTGILRTSEDKNTPIKHLASATATAQHLRVHISLNDLAHSIFALNKDIFFGQVMVLTVNFAEGTRMSVIGAGAGTFTAVPTNVPVLSNVYLQLACETNEQLNASLIEKTNKDGVVLNIPYVYTFKQSNATTTSATQQVRLGSNHGQRLLKVYNSFMNNTETAASCYTPITAGLTVRTAINNQFLQDYALRHASNELYLFQKNLFIGSGMMSSADFAAWLVYCDNFTKSLPREHDQDSVVDGLDLTANEILYQITVGLTSAAFVQYCHCVVQRTLSIQGSQITIR